uniref:glycosyltransferase family 4 protein n=1 Tax=Algoriphagus sp. TaxID=1872435 RepID=UPI0040484809
MKILYIAPLPPPITGHSLVSKVLIDELEKTHETFVIDLSKDSFKEGIDGFKRIVQIVKILIAVWSQKDRSQRIYFTISESFAGNLKDLLIYLICYRSLDRMYIHLHGGSIKRLLWDKYDFIKRSNRFFIKRLRGVIISGESHRPIFSDILPREKIHIIPNFAQDYLFVDQSVIDRKYELPKIFVLYMSNLIPKKGYNELLEAFLLLDEEFKAKIQLDFAGAFDSEDQKNLFLEKISGYEQVTYHGVVNEETKRKLFSQAHVFCLPTSYFEGQPISILEAYASGCVVVTTAQSGILDIFESGVNGFVIRPGSSESIKEVLERLFQKKDKMHSISSYNLSTALQRFRTSIYSSTIKKILEA